MTYSYSAGIKDTLPLESFLQRRALENVEPSLIYMNDAQVMEQPKNGGKHAKFFRYTELPAAPDPLVEGVTPAALDLTETSFTVMTKQYGKHMEFTDEIDLWHVDQKTIAMSDRLNRQAKLTIDTVTRDALCAGLNVMFPGSVSSRGAITASDKISYAMIKKAVRNLKNKGAQPFADGFFHAKIDHDTYYDLSGDSHWIAVAQYQDDKRVQRYELGTIYNVKFFEADNGKVFTTESYLYGTKAYLTASADFDAANRTMTVADTMTEDEARALTGKLVYVQYSSTYNTLMCVERVYPSGTANTTKIVFRWVPDSSVTSNWTTSNTLKVVPTGGGNSVDVHASLIYGQNAFGCISLGTKSKPNIRIILKPVGSSGSLDPIDQRGSVAWKVPFFAAAILQDDFIVRLEHAVSA